MDESSLKLTVVSRYAEVAEGTATKLGLSQVEFRKAVSDMAWAIEPEPQVRNHLEAIVGCIGGALVIDDYVARLKAAGFAKVEVETHNEAVLAISMSRASLLHPVSNT